MSFDVSKILENHSFSEFSSMRTGGRVAYMFLPESIEELLQGIVYFQQNVANWYILGNASNVLFPDEDFAGGVIFTTKIKGVEVSGQTICAKCGVSLSSLAKIAADNSLTGLEFAYGIPGTVGGGVFMNAGAYEGELSQCLREAVCLDHKGKVVTLKSEDMDFGYRKSILQKNNFILLEAIFSLKKGVKSDINNIMEGFMTSRREKQPLEYPSCGSVFKRPKGDFAGRLISQCGLKGHTIGGAQVSEKHAGFIINKGNATTADVLKLMDYVTKTVQEQTGVVLEPEVRILRG